MAQCRVLDVTPQTQLRPSKVTPPADNTWPSTKKRPSNNVLTRTFTPPWRACNGFKIQNLGDYKILFNFGNKPNVDRILQNELWCFDKHLVMMQRYEKDVPIQDLMFDMTHFWVQIHGIPLR